MSVLVESLDHEGHGIARLEDGKVVFIEGALPGELVEYKPIRKKKRFDTAVVTEVLRQSPMRAEPKCKYFDLCGGCSMQHLEASAQVAAKQRILEDNLQRIGHVTPENILRPIHGQAWGYRHRARMSMRYVDKKGGVLVGFHEKRSRFIVDMESCEVMPARISALIRPLRDVAAKLSIRERLPQAEFALGDDVDVVVLRNMEALSAEDETLLRAFADEQHVQIWLQPKGPDSAYPFHPLDAPELTYGLPEFDVVMPFRPTEFTQVNMGVNRMLVRRAMQLLDPQPGERIADLFCGLGNFSLPMARRGATVLGVEGNQELVRRAQANAVRNNLPNASFVVANLFGVTPESLSELGHFDKMLIDPPRDGAFDLVNALGGNNLPHRIVYISCSPATLARDAEVLVHHKGYRLLGAGVANMFPHTAHVESIAIFEQ